MANITVTYDDINVYVNFGDYYYGSGQPKAMPQTIVPNRKVRYKRYEVVIVAEDPNEDFVKVRVASEFPATWKLTYDNLSTEAFTIDSVNGVVPTDNEHLNTLLEKI